jgi:hypothetical protein
MLSLRRWRACKRSLWHSSLSASVRALAEARASRASALLPISILDIRIIQRAFACYKKAVTSLWRGCDFRKAGVTARCAGRVLTPALKGSCCHLREMWAMIGTRGMRHAPFGSSDCRYSTTAVMIIFSYAIGNRRCMC